MVFTQYRIRFQTLLTQLTCSNGNHQAPQLRVGIRIKTFRIRPIERNQCCGTKYIEFGSGSRITLSILKEKLKIITGIYRNYTGNNTNVTLRNFYSVESLYCEFIYTGILNLAPFYLHFILYLHV